MGRGHVKARTFTAQSTARSSFTDGRVMGQAPYAGNASKAMAAIKSMLGSWARVGDGDFHRPDKQSKLDAAMAGQVLFCPSCGQDVHGLTESYVECPKCKAAYWITLGYNAVTGDIAVCRIDRYR